MDMSIQLTAPGLEVALAGQIVRYILALVVDWRRMGHSYSHFPVAIKAVMETVRNA